MSSPQSISIKANSTLYNIKVLDKDTVDKLAKKGVNNQAVNIFASGPSIIDVEFTQDLLNMPSMFVNGSISLTKEHDFKNILGYIISDKRFIKHNPEVLALYYKSQPLFAIQDVFEAMAIRLPDLIKWYHNDMHVIYPVDRPLLEDADAHWLTTAPILSRLNKLNKLVSQKRPLSELVNHSSFVIEPNHKPNPIGVSIDITEGFVEAGTVAYVAAQLAFTLKASAIHLYGIDLINSQQPRFYEDKDNVAPCKLDKAVTDRIVPSFDLLGFEYKKRGVAVINHSPVSKILFKCLSIPSF